MRLPDEIEVDVDVDVPALESLRARRASEHPPGGMISLSSNGSQAGTGVLWAMMPLSGDANHDSVPGVLRTFSAENLTQQLWNSTLTSSDNTMVFAKGSSPVVANGKVYVPSLSNAISVYGPALANEAETTASAGETAGRVVRAFADTNMSGGNGKIIEGHAAGDFMAFTVNIPRSGNYGIRVRMKKTTNRGIWQLSIDGVNHGAAQDGYVAGTTYDEVDLGTRALTAGNHTYRFQVTGRNASSTDFWIALDYIKTVERWVSMTVWIALAVWIGATPRAATVPAPADAAAAPPDALTTASGVAMTILKAGQGQGRPAANDCVQVHFTAWKRNGSFLASSRPAGPPDSQCLTAMFPGVADALQTMVVGEERRLWVPAALTYPDDDDAPARADVTFDVELLEIQNAPPTPRDLKPPPSARKTPSGLALQVLNKGRGREHPGPGSLMTLHFSGWTAEGRLVESSVMAGLPATYELEGVMPGWREALPTMVVGEQVRIWIPAALAFGEKPRRGQPRGDLVYELELLDLR